MARNPHDTRITQPYVVSIDRPVHAHCTHQSRGIRCLFSIRWRPASAAPPHDADPCRQTARPDTRTRPCTATPTKRTCVRGRPRGRGPRVKRPLVLQHWCLARRDTTKACRAWPACRPHRHDRTERSKKACDRGARACARRPVRHPRLCAARRHPFGSSDHKETAGGRAFN